MARKIDFIFLLYLILLFFLVTPISGVYSNASYISIWGYIFLIFIFSVSWISVLIRFKYSSVFLYISLSYYGLLVYDLTMPADYDGLARYHSDTYYYIRIVLGVVLALIFCFFIEFYKKYYLGLKK
ncbi:hypothetical protein VQ643_15890 [Pseudomonas sp. F1_0610]|uniref:hypothetical protein n=1 Tax=Pseudomonas sp. F1_0610 TaxID=3114284 RepID=UPI0039C314C4